MSKVTASVYASAGKKIRVFVPDAMCSAVAREEISLGRRLCGYRTGRRWGIVYTYNIWTKPNGTVYGDEYIAYDLTDSFSRMVFERIVSNYGHVNYRF